jgi:hypothetical protein
MSIGSSFSINGSLESEVFKDNSGFQIEVIHNNIEEVSVILSSNNVPKVSM